MPRDLFAEMGVTDTRQPRDLLGDDALNDFGPGPAPITRPQSARNSFLRGLIDTVAAVPKAIDEGAIALANQFGDSPILGNPEKRVPEDLALHQIGDALSQWAQKKFPTSPEYEKEFFAGKLPGGLGSTAGFAAGGLAGALAKIPAAATVATLGAAAQGVGQVEDYKKAMTEQNAPVDPQMRAQAFGLGLPLGTTEALPIARLLARLDHATGGGVKRILAQGVKGGLEEATQEVVQQIGQNYVANGVLKYDPDRGLFNEAADNAAVGGGVGFLLNTLAATIGGRRAHRPAPATPEDLGRAMQDAVDQRTLSAPVPMTDASSTAPAPRDVLARMFPQSHQSQESAHDIPATTVADQPKDLLASVSNLEQPQAASGAAFPEVNAPPPVAQQDDALTDRRSTPREPDRRQDLATRKTVASMTPDEMRQALHTDELTGLRNRRAYNDNVPKPVQASIDVDSLKWINDNMGHGAGDALLQTLGQALKDEQVDAFRFGGDEFVAQHDNEAELDTKLARVLDRLKSANLEYTAPDGTKTVKTGIGFSYGKGPDLKTADEQLAAAKLAREQQGLRAPRGGIPGGVVKTPAQGRQAENNVAAEGQAQDVATAPLPKETAASLPKRDAKLTQEQVEQYTYRLETPVSHRDAVAKALKEGEPVPDHIRSEYPDLQGGGKESQEAPDVGSPTPDVTKKSPEVTAKTGKGISRARATKVISKTIGNKPAQALLDAGHLVLVEDEADLPKAGQASVKKDVAQGITTGGKMHLNLAALSEADLSGVALREGLHATLKSVIGEQDYSALMERMDALRTRDQGGLGTFFKGAIAAAEAAKTPEAQMTEEIAAYAVEQYTNARRSLPQALAKWVRDFLSKIKTGLLRTLPQGNPLRAWLLSTTSESDLAQLAIAGLRKVAKGEVVDEQLSDTRYSKRKPPTDDIGLQYPGSRPPKQKKPPSDSGGVSGVDKFISEHGDEFDKKRWLDKVKDVRPETLALLSRGMLAELGSDVLPQMATYERIAQAMDARRNHLLNEAAQTATPWGEWAQKNKATADRLAALMHDTTIEGVDPSKDYVALTTAAETKQKIRAIHQQIRGRSGENTAALMAKKDAAKAQLAFENKRAAAYPELKRRFDALPDEAKKIYQEVRDFYQERQERVVAALEARIERAQVSDNEKAKLKTQIRQTFESNRVQGPYFPLARFGDFWASGKKGDEQIFYLFETSNEQRKYVAAMKSDGYEVKFGKKLQNAKAIHGASESFVADVIKVLDKTGAPEDVKDTVYQLFLSTLPDLSARKNFIHRKKTKGFSHDALRAFASQTFHGSYQLARLEHADQLQSQLESARKEIPQSSDPNKAADILNEMEQRHQWIMNPTSKPWANAATSITFAWYMGLSPATALVNMLQTPMVAYPVMAAQFGWGKSASALTASMKHFMAHPVNFETGLSTDEAKAMVDMTDLGVIDKTRAHDLVNMAESPSAIYKDWRAKTLGILSFGFHHAERFNRQVTALAAYRLAREQGMNHAHAVDVASDAVWEGHFNYANSNRPRFMQGDIAKVAFQFKQYSVNMLWLLGRNTYLSIKGESQQVKTAARRKLAGILGMTALFAGANGMWMYFVVEMLMNAIFGSDPDDPWDFDTELKNFLADYFGETAAHAIMKGPVEAATGVGVSSRVSLNELWLREPDKHLEGRAVVQYWAEQTLGPSYGILGNMAAAYDLIKEGHVERGIETAIPKFMRDGLRALRYADEGVRTLRGDSIMDDTSAWQEGMQALGFAPGELNWKYDANRALRNKMDALSARRQNLIDLFMIAKRRGDTAARQEAKDKILAWNKAQPHLRITQDTLMQSGRSRDRYSKETRDGVHIPKNMRNLKDDVRYAQDQAEE